MAFQIKRVYDDLDPSDGYRVLVDRLWPRGMTKERATLDAWMKTVAPTSKLRTWFRHDPTRFVEFQEQYRDELESADSDAVTDIATLRERAASGTVTLLYAARDPECNHALILQEWLEG